MKITLLLILSLLFVLQLFIENVKSTSIKQISYKLKSQNYYNKRKLQKSQKTNHNNNHIELISDEKSTHQSSHSISMASALVNIIADLCPHGMLPLSYGFAQGGPSGILPAIALIIIFGGMSAYTMVSYASMAEDYKVKTISEIWTILVNEKTKLIADLSIFLLCFGCCVFYSSFIGDIFTALAEAIKLPGLFSKRYVLLGLLTTFILAPLCLQEDLSALQFSSILGVTGILFTVFVHIYRLIDGSYNLKSSSTFLSDFTPKQIPNFPTPKFNLFNVNFGTLTLVNMLCVAFLAHYNAINYFNELEGKSLQKYKLTVAIGYGISILVFATMMLVGYSLFGTTSQPLLLNNFHNTKDILATFARLGTGSAILFAYPLMFAGLKSALKSILTTKSKEDNKYVLPSPLIYKSLQVAILSIITSIAFKCSEEDVSIVLGIVGSVLGCGCAYVLPGYLQLINMRKKKMLGVKNSKFDIISNHLLVGLGILFGILGVGITIRDSQHSHNH